MVQLRSQVRPGDIGWVVRRHGQIYAAEYGWDEHFEALVAQIAGGFLNGFDARAERLWIAERDCANAGCVFLARKSEGIAQLRLLLVEPDARGLGIGKRLIDECIAFARQARYEKIVLWTTDVLHAARHLYANAGFKLAGQERERLFGKELLSEHWQLALQ